MKNHFGFKPVSLVIIIMMVVCGLYFSGGRAVSAATPRLQVRANTDQVEGYEWTIGTTVTVHIGDKDFYGDVGPAPWDPNLGYVSIHLAGLYDIQPGDTVTMTEGGTTKSTLVTALEITGYDLSHDTVSGKADKGSRVDLWANYDPANNYIRHVTADEQGKWTADFSKPGIGSDEQATFHILPGTWLNAQQWDQDTDATEFGISVPIPRLYVNAKKDQVQGQEWPKGETITVKVGGQEFTGTVGNAPWDPNLGYVSIDLAGRYDLKPGDIVTMTDGPIIKTTVVTDLEITSYDLEKDTVQGKATPGARVDVWTNDGTTNYNRHVITDPYGDWLADYSKPGTQPDEQNTFDIVPGTWIDSQESDKDYDATEFGVSVPLPWMDVRANTDLVEGQGWAIGETVTVKIGSLEKQGAVVPAPWDANLGYVVVSFSGLYDIKPGDSVSMTGGVTTKTTLVTDLEITDFDLSQDTVRGKAAKGSRVDLWAYGNGMTNVNRHVVADGNGDWVADFSKPGHEADEQNTFDIAPGTQIDSQQMDKDYDSTMFELDLPNPTIDAHLNENYVWGYGWKIGSTVTLSVDDPKTPLAPDFTSSGLVGTSDWDPNLGAVKIYLGPNFLLKTGQVITLSDGKIPKTLTVMDLYVKSFNQASRTAIGHADPGAQVQVEFWGTNGDRLDIQAGPDGSWTAHSTLSLDPFYYTTNGIARSADVDGDTTSYFFGNGSIWARPFDSSFMLFGCNNYQTYVMTIDDPSNGKGVDFTHTYSYKPVDPNAPCDIHDTLTGIKLAAGDIITLTSQHYVRTLVIRPLKTPHFNIIADAITGKGRPGDWIFTWVAPGISRDSYVNPSGNWSADYSIPIGSGTTQAAVDILPGQGWGIAQIDAEGNWSQDGTTVPLPSSGSASGLGWFSSPAGAYTSSPKESGKAAFGFDVKYGKKQPLPMGTVVFTIKGFVFQSSSFDWLAVQDGRMQLTGSGKVNRQGDYGFMIAAATTPARDGDKSASQSKGTIRIRIWRKDTGEVVYDTMAGAADSVVPVTVIQDGKIKLTP